MIGTRQWKILALILMAVVGVGLGIWLFRAGYTTLGCVWVGVFLWRGQQFSIWLIAPSMAPSDITLVLTSRLQRLLLSIVCVLGAAVCAVGVYVGRLLPGEWQVGLVFVLFGLPALAPVTIKEIQSRRKTLAQIEHPTTQ